MHTDLKIAKGKWDNALLTDGNCQHFVSSGMSINLIAQKHHNLAKHDSHMRNKKATWSALSTIKGCVPYSTNMPKRVLLSRS
jgi:hypothetical protein